MSIPNTVMAQLRSLEKKCRELDSAASREWTQEEISVAVADICNACVLTLDKAANAIWQKYNTKSEDKKKANVYFPHAETRELLIWHLKKSQLPAISNPDGRLFRLIESCQPYSGQRWLSDLRRIADQRHETYPDIKSEHFVGIGFGFQQDIDIFYATVKDGIVDFRGQARNPVTGYVEPMKISFAQEVHNILAENRQYPHAFCRSTVSHVRQTVEQVYLEL